MHDCPAASPGHHDPCNPHAYNAPNACAAFTADSQQQNCVLTQPRPNWDMSQSTSTSHRTLENRTFSGLRTTFSLIGDSSHTRLLGLEPSGLVGRPSRRRTRRRSRRRGTAALRSTGSKSRTSGARRNVPPARSSIARGRGERRRRGTSRRRRQKGARKSSPRKLRRREG